VKKRRTIFFPLFSKEITKSKCVRSRKILYLVVLKKKWIDFYDLD